MDETLGQVLLMLNIILTALQIVQTVYLWTNRKILEITRKTIKRVDSKLDNTEIRPQK